MVLGGISALCIAFSLIIVFFGITAPTVLEVSFFVSGSFVGFSGLVFYIFKIGLLVVSIFFLEKPPAADSAHIS